MTGAASSKGNPATTRMSNAKLKEKRARAWARGEKRKPLHVAANEARRKANIDALGDWYEPRAVMTQLRLRRVYEGKTPVLKLIPVTVSLPPSKQLSRLRYKGRAA